MESLAASLLLLLALVVLTGPIILAGLLVWWQLPPEQRWLLPPQRHRAVPWHGIDVLFAFVVQTFLRDLVLAALRHSGFFQMIYGHDLPLRDPHAAVWAAALAMPLQLLLILAELRRLRGVKLYQVGLTFRNFARNVVAGYLVWMLFTPLVLTLYALVSQRMSPEEHSLFRIARDKPEVVDWVVLFFSAVVAAPLIEELVFRGILLPWLSRASAGTQVVVACFTLMIAGFLGLREHRGWDPGPLVFAAGMLPGYWLVPWTLRVLRAPRRPPPAPVPAVIPEEIASPPLLPDTGIQASEALPMPPPLMEMKPIRLAAIRPLVPDREANAARAIYGSSLLFAAFHSTVWPSPIPLLVLAMGLGWLAYRTQSLVAPMVLHGLFNALPCVLLLVAHLIEPSALERKSANNDLAPAGRRFDGQFRSGLLATPPHISQSNDAKPGRQVRGRDHADFLVLAKEPCSGQDEARKLDAQKHAIDMAAVAGHHDRLLAQIAPFGVTDRIRSADFHDKPILVHVHAVQGQARLNPEHFEHIRRTRRCSRGEQLLPQGRGRICRGEEVVTGQPQDIVASDAQDAFS
jgi:membrane protease YdiL (CAAX protease family)